MNQRLFTVCAIVIVLLLSASPCLSGSSTNVRGSIFTTLSDGSAVNANHFESKCAVYLDGGPGPNAPATAASLADGDYYFQVTDPSGKTLLSTDPVSNRRMTVTNGVFTAYAGTGGPIHPIGIDRDHPELGAITVRLANTTCPADFADSPNNGGAYKVWATPVTEFVGDPEKVDNVCGSGCYHGFQTSKSKTDNFKAKTGTATFCLTVKERVLQWDVYSPAEGWQINITDPLGVQNSYYTDAAGQVQVCGLTEGGYTVTETLPPDAVTVGLVVNGTELPSDTIYSFTWTPDKPPAVVEFTNVVGIGPQ